MKRLLPILILIFLSSSLFAQEVVEHRVKWYETINTIASKYGIDPETILQYNGLTSDEVKSRVVLKIPVSIIPVADTTATENQEDLDTEDSTAVANILYSQDNPLKVSLVLPFGAVDENPSTNYFDFYSGALMALHNAKSNGYSVELNIFDSKGNANAILDNPAFAASDLVIGPVRSGEIEKFSTFCSANNIPLVSPMDHSAEKFTAENPLFFQVPASAAQQMSNMISSLKKDPDGVVLVFFDSSMKEEKFLKSITNQLDEAGIFYRKIGYGILKGRDFSETLQKELNPEKRYKAIVASEDDAFAPDIVRNMRVLRLFGISVELFCSNRVRNFDSIDSDSFYELSAHVCAPYFIDYEATEVKQFILKYRALFNAEPTPYSYQGFDILTYFINGFCKYGSNFASSASEYPAQLLQCNISFSRDDEKSGWRNTATRNLIYQEDFTISIEQQDRD